MAVVTGADRADPAERVERRPSVLGVGTVIWLASELMFFAGLFAAYFTLRAENEAWPAEGVELETARTAVATLVLVGSSVTMHFGVAAARTDDRAGARRWLAMTMVLGALFLANQGFEYVEAPFSISSHAYGSMFFLMTGFHGLHVLGGLFFMAVVAGVISGDRSRASAGEVVDVCGYYWHFVDVVWVVMFATIYVLR
ncbi:MAG: aa3-type cytochrome oxidase subunit III [Acidimicrobiales bacterium]